MSSNIDEQQPPDKNWEPWHEQFAKHADGDGHVTLADSPPRAFDKDSYQAPDSSTKPLVAVDCGWCGRELHRPPKQAKRADGRNFCDPSCGGLWHAHNNHEYISFQNRRSYNRKSWRDAVRDALISVAYQPSWNTQKTALHEDQAACEICGKSADDVPLDSHHLVPVLRGGTTFSENLAVLCKGCHGRAEEYINEHLEEHFRLPRASETVRILEPPSERREPDQCIHCDREAGGDIPVEPRPIVPIEAGGTYQLTYPVCTKCYHKHHAYLYRKVIDSDMVFFGELPEEEALGPPEINGREFEFDPHDVTEGCQPQYTEAELIEEIQRLAEELGRTPTQREMKERGRYSATPYYRAFDSWAAALREAGFEPVTEQKISKDALLEEIHRLHEQLGRAPRQSEMNERGKYTPSPYYRAFDSWSTAVREAGFEPAIEQKLSKKALIDEIRRLHEGLGKTPSFEDFEEYGRYSADPIYRVFGSFTDAIEEAGFEPLSRGRQQYPKEELLEDLRRLKNEHGKVTGQIIQAHGKYSRSVYYDRFGSLTDAKRLAGVD